MAASIVGDRFKRVSVENFLFYDGRQREVKQAVLEYESNLDDNYQKGRNLSLTGPVGTGKDHLGRGVILTAWKSGYTVCVE